MQTGEGTGKSRYLLYGFSRLPLWFMSTSTCSVTNPTYKLDYCSLVYLVECPLSIISAS